MKTNPQYESMTRIKLRHWVVRVWRTEANTFEACNARNDDLHELGREVDRKYYDMHTIVMQFKVMPRVSAVEVLNCEGNGVVVYPDWK